MKKVFTLFAAAMMLCTMSFAQKAETTTVLKSTRFAPAKLTRNVAKNGPKVSGNPIWGNTMSYCLDGEFYNHIGTGETGTTIYWGIQIEANALVGRDNLTDVEFFVGYAGTYMLNIYSGANPATGTSIFSQTVTTTIDDTMGWKNVHFTTPLPINQGQNLWIVLSNSDLEYPAASVSPNEYDNGKWFSFDGEEWMSVAEAGVDVTWMIRAISDTYIVLPPMVTLQGPAAVRVGDTVQYMANSGNADSYTWTVNADYYDNTTDNVVTVMWENAGLQQVIVMATNDAGDTYDTLEVDVFSCGDIELPYIPSFVGGLGCWTSRSDSTESGWYASVDMFESNPEGQVLSMSAQSVWGLFMMDIPTDNWLFSPAIEMPATGEYEVAWQVKPFNASYSGDHYGVYVINGNDTTLLFEESLTGITDYAQRMAIIPSTVSGDFQVAFRHFNSEGGYVIILDDIQIRNLTAPQVTIAGPSEVENGTTATFVATAPNASSFEWAIDGVAVDANGNTLVNTFTEDGFYTISVLASNSEGSSEDTLVVEVYSCNGIDEFPYTMGFEGGIRCWSMVSADPTNDDRFGVYEDEEAFEGNYDFRFSSYSSANDYNQFLISPELSLPADDYMFMFQYKGYTAEESFRVLSSTTTNDVTAFTNVLGTYEVTNREWTTVAFRLPEGTKYVAINYYGNYEYYLYVDNLSIGEINIAPMVELDGPTMVEVDEDVTFVCNAPLATSFAWTVDGTDVNTTDNMLTTSFATAGAHTVTVIASNAVGGTTATLNVTAISCDITSLPYLEDFEGESADCWHLSENFNALSNPDYAHSGSTFIYCNYDDYADLDEWAVSPAIHMPADASNLGISWYVWMMEYEGIQNTYEVRVSTTGRNPEDFTTLIFSETGASNNFVQRGWNLADFGGQTIYIAFHNISAAGGDVILFDDIYIGTGVGIEDVDNVNVSVYPNPANDVLNIEGEGIQKVELMDVNGRTVMTTANAGSLNISTLAMGVYVVRVITNNGISTQKIVKK